MSWIWACLKSFFLKKYKGNRKINLSFEKSCFTRLEHFSNTQALVQQWSVSSISGAISSQPQYSEASKYLETLALQIASFSRFSSIHGPLHLTVQFSSSYNHNKHERAKGHGPKNETTGSRNIPFDEETEMFTCPINGCTTSSKYKHNIVKHLKSCYDVNKYKKSAAQDKTCNICGKELARKSNRDWHFKQFHSTNEAESDIEEPEIPEIEEPVNEESPFTNKAELAVPTMAATFSDHHEVVNLTSEAEQQPASSTSSPPNVDSCKQSRLESIINKITNNIDYSFAYMQDCFDSMLDDDDFLKWLAPQSASNCIV